MQLIPRHEQTAGFKAEWLVDQLEQLYEAWFPDLPPNSFVDKHLAPLTRLKEIDDDDLLQSIVSREESGEHIGAVDVIFLALAFAVQAGRLAEKGNQLAWPYLFDGVYLLGQLRGASAEPTTSFSAKGLADRSHEARYAESRRQMQEVNDWLDKYYDPTISVSDTAQRLREAKIGHAAFRSQETVETWVKAFRKAHPERC